jgi:hypothetical protein
MVIPYEIDAAECDLVAAFEPALALLLPFFLRKDRNKHALAKK